jgi:hypothetical protein
MCLQGEEMKKETKIDGKNIEEEFQFHGLQAGESPPEYWRNLGSSKTRTKEQEIKGRDLILQKITEITENTAIAFTDGSCLNNPGPCGAGAIVGVEILLLCFYHLLSFLFSFLPLVNTSILMVIYAYQ